MEFGLDKRAQTLQGLAFPLQEEAQRALQQLKQRRINYIQLVSLDKNFLSLITQCAKCNRLPVNNNNKKTCQDLFLKKKYESVFVSKADYGWLDLNKACV